MFTVFSSLDDSSILAGPALLPPEPTHAILALHGFGADGSNLVPLARPLQEALTTTLAATLAPQPCRLAFVAPDAPAFTPFGEGRQWFKERGWTFRDPEGLAKLQEPLNATLAELGRQTGVPPERTVVLGFSQGGMVLLGLLPQLTPCPGGIVTLSSAMTMPPADLAAGPRVPIFMSHGLADDILPADRSVEAAEALRAAGHDVTLRLVDGLPHGIDGEVLGALVTWLTALWGAPASS